MTESISAAEAKAHFAKYLRTTEQGGSILITRHGKPVAALVPAEELAQMTRLRAAGPEAGLAGLAGGWKNSDALVERVATIRRSAARRAPRVR